MGADYGGYDEVRMSETDIRMKQTLKALTAERHNHKCWLNTLEQLILQWRDRAKKYRNDGDKYDENNSQTQSYLYGCENAANECADELETVLKLDILRDS